MEGPGWVPGRRQSGPQGGVTLCILKEPGIKASLVNGLGREGGAPVGGKNVGDEHRVSLDMTLGVQNREEPGRATRPKAFETLMETVAPRRAPVVEVIRMERDRARGGLSRVVR